MIVTSTPIIFFDVETTGVHVSVDRIIQLGLIKLLPDGTKKEWSSYFNPEMPIPPEVSGIHHITDSMVQDAPSFKQSAPLIAAGFKFCDYAGYNVDFDISFLRMEFKRAGVNEKLNGRRLDAYKIFTKKHPRSLSAAIQTYLHRDINSGAHDALVDIRETYELLQAMMNAHPELPRDMEGLYKQYYETPKEGFVDADGRLYWRNGVACLNFGKYPGKPLSEIPRDYLKWMLSQSFSQDVVRIVTDALDGKFPLRKLASL